MFWRHNNKTHPKNSINTSRVYFYIVYLTLIFLTWDGVIITSILNCVHSLFHIQFLCCSLAESVHSGKFSNQSKSLSAYFVILTTRCLIGFVQLLSYIFHKFNLNLNLRLPIMFYNLDID